MSVRCHTTPSAVQNEAPPLARLRERVAGEGRPGEGVGRAAANDRCREASVRLRLTPLIPLPRPSPTSGRREQLRRSLPVGARP